MKSEPGENPSTFQDRTLTWLGLKTQGHKEESPSLLHFKDRMGGRASRCGQK